LICIEWHVASIAEGRATAQLQYASNGTHGIATILLSRPLLVCIRGTSLRLLLIDAIAARISARN